MTNKIGVLLVDDEVIDLSAARLALEAGGECEVFSASTFAAALQVFKQHGDGISLAVLDVSLPGRNGVDLAKELLALRPDLRILFVSGHVGASVIRFHGIEATDQQFLKKPFDSATLIERVRQILESPKARQVGSGAGDSPTEPA
jgi:DNA-binding response OmpR family regulator